MWLLYFAGHLSSASPTELLSQRSTAIQHWTSSQGLPQDSVLSMLQSSEGYLWLGTEAGLVRFDGVHFVTYDQRNTPALGSDLILALAEDINRTLWIGTSGGGLNQLHSGRIQRCGGQIASLGNTVYAVAIDANGGVWIGTERGLSVIRGTEVHHFTEQEGVPQTPTYSVLVNTPEDVWFATYGSGFGRLRSDHATIWNKKDGLPDARVILLGRGEGDTVLVSCYGGQLLRFSNGIFQLLRSRSKSSTNRGIWAIVNAPNGGKIVGSFGAGLGVVEGHSLRFLTGGNALPVTTVWCLLRDKEDNLWAGTSDGLFRIRHLAIDTFSKIDGLPSDNISAVWQSKQHGMLIGTAAGLVQFDAENKSASSRPTVLAQHVVSIIQDRAHNLWLGTTSAGLWRRTGARPPKSVPGPWGAATIYALAVETTSVDTLWVGTFGEGLFSCRDLASDSLTCIRVNEVKSSRIISILIAHTGSVWVGTRDGLYQSQHGAWRKFDSADGLRNSNIASLFEDDRGVLWIGTEKGGLGRYRNGQIDWSTTAGGLFDNSIYSILKDSLGFLWLGSTKGIFRINPSQFPGSAQNPLNSISFGLADGMLSTECTEDTPNAALRASDGSLWFGTVKGLAHLQPVSAPGDGQPPPVLIEQLKIDGEALAPPLTSITIGPDTRHIEAMYTALSLAWPEGQQFRYRLQGFDTGWVDAGTNRTASYTNLPPGHYALIVQARTARSFWNLKGATLQLEIQPHFYDTVWFQILAVLTAILLVITGYLLRVRLLRREFAAVLSERLRSVREQDKIKTENLAQLARMNAGLSDNLSRLASGTDLQTVMEEILLTAVDQLDADNACLFIYNETDKTLERAFSAGVSVPPPGSLREAYYADCPAVVMAKDLAIWRDFQEHNTIRILDLENHEDAPLFWPEAIYWHKKKGQSMVLGIPLRLGTKTLGFMGVNFKTRFKAADFPIERRNLANSLSSLASMALESHRLSLRARDAAIGEERGRLSEEMHDGIQQIFVAISFQLGGIQNIAKRAHNPAELMPQIERTAEIAEHGLREVRRSVDAFRDAAPLSPDELLDNLKALCRSSDSEQTRCILSIGFNLRLPTSPRLNELYRIAQEAVNNAFRHANASAIQVKLERREETLYFSVSDNGRGFSVESSDSRRGGMRNLRERVKRLGGALEIISVPGSTMVLVTIPNASAL